MKHLPCLALASVLAFQAAGNDHRAARPLFEKVARELDLRIPDSKDALYREYLVSIAHDILDGTRSPAAALKLERSHNACP